MENENGINEEIELTPETLEKKVKDIQKQSNKEMLRAMVRSTYDLQNLRMMYGNRICAAFRSRLGIAPSDNENEIDDKNKKILKELKENYKKVTDAMAVELSKENEKERDTVGKLPRESKFKGNSVISSYGELCMIHQYFETEALEARSFRQIEKFLEAFPIYTGYLKNVRGVGPAMAGVIISEMDISKARYVSSLWKYCGLDVVVTPNPETGELEGVARSMRKEHMVEVEYKDRNGEMQKRISITFKPFLRAKMRGVLASSFLRCGSPYAKIYYDYKNRIENHPKHVMKTKAHRNNMALRYMIQRFFVDLYVNWRKIEGLEVHPEYAVAKLGLVHRGGE